MKGPFRIARQEIQAGIAGEKPATTEPMENAVPKPMPRCLIEDIFDPEVPSRPCGHCQGNSLIEFKTREVPGLYRMWSVECSGKRIITFRVADGSTPQKRFKAIVDEYDKHFEAAVDRSAKRYRHDLDPNYAALMNLVPVNATFQAFVGLRPLRYRPATVCEVAAWLHTHRDDWEEFLTNPITELAKLLPTTDPR